MTHAKNLDAIATLAVIRSNLAAMLAHVDALSELLEQHSLGGPPTPLGGDTPFQLDRASFAVRWKRSGCELGNCAGFRLLERLARRPNQYVAFDALLEHVWDSPRTYSTLRSTVSRLRSRLSGHGLAELAQRIDGRAHGHYRLDLAKE